MDYHSVDIQWGNHDISWMGAACGNQALIANVIRIALSYNNFDLLEDGYKPVEFLKNKEKYSDCEGSYSFYFEEEEDKIIEKLQAIRGENEEVTVTISGDQGANYGRVIGLMALLKEAGFEKVGLQTQSKPLRTKSKK